MRWAWIGIFLLLPSLVPSVELWPTVTVRCALYRIRLDSVVASWYGPGFNGKRMANGKRFDQHKMTVASRTLPLGTRIRICRVDQPRLCTEAVTTDRGPYVDGRGLDVSLAVANKLKMKKKGLARVWITILPQRSLAGASISKADSSRPSPRSRVSARR